MRNSSSMTGYLHQLEASLERGDDVEIVTVLSSMALAGNVVSFADVAELYENGTDDLVPRPDLAFRWYQKSAFEQIDTAGYFGMARCYFTGFGVAKDQHRAAQYFEEAYSLGSMESAVMLGMTYFRGDGGGVDKERAEKYAGAAAKKGYLVAQYILMAVSLEKRAYWRALKQWVRFFRLAKYLLKNNPDDPRLYLYKEISAL